MKCMGILFRSCSWKVERLFDPSVGLFRFHVVSVYDLLVDPRISNISDIGDGDGER